MRNLLLATILLCLAAIAACSDDSIPRAAELSAPIEEPVTVSQSEPAKTQASVSAAEEPVAQAEPTVEDEVRNDVLIMRMAEEVQVFPYPADGLHQPDRIGAAALLLADGWLEGEDDQVWLRLDMNGERVGWIRLADSPLTLEEAQTLPGVPLPSLPTVELSAPGGESRTMTLVGRSADRRYLAVRHPAIGSEVVWIVHKELPSNAEVRSLPIYVGAVWGRWSSQAAIDAAPLPGEVRVTASFDGWQLDVYPSPRSAPSPIRLSGASIDGAFALHFPVIGRDFEGEWIALRMDQFAGGHFWAHSEDLQLSAGVEDLPILVSVETEVFRLSDAGTLASLRGRAPYFSSWRWRDNGTIVGVNSEGIWRWEIESDQLIKLEESHWVNFSPDGKHAAYGVAVDRDWNAGESARDVVILSTVDGERHVFAGVNRRHFTHHDDDPSLIWSTDSRFLISQHQSAEMGGVYVLGIDGSQSDLLPDSAHWIRGSAVGFRRDEGAFRLYDPTHGEVREVTELEAGPIRVGRPGELGQPRLPDGVEVDRLREAVAISADGRWSVYRTRQYAAEFDEQGLSVPARIEYGSRRPWMRVAFYIIDNESGEIAARVQTVRRICWDSTRADFSPDSRSIAFSGVRIDCT